MLSPGTGLGWEARDRLVGRKAIRNLGPKSIISLEDFS